MPIMRQKTGGNRPGGGRPYIPRPCVVCSAESTIAAAIYARTIGRGQSAERRKIRQGESVLLCDGCFGNVASYTHQLQAAAAEAIKFLTRRGARPPGPGLFAEELGGGDHQHQELASV